jgi:hypothetical protein
MELSPSSRHAEWQRITKLGGIADSGVALLRQTFGSLWSSDGMV